MLPRCTLQSVVTIVLSALLLAGCAAQRQEEPAPSRSIDPGDIPVESLVLVDVDDSNSAAATAAEAGEVWPLDALSVAERFVGEMSGRYLSIEKVDEPTESPKATTITIIRGGYLDDSVWGTWDQLTLSRQPDGTWRIDEARRAWRCYRGHQTDFFGERWCL